MPDILEQFKNLAIGKFEIVLQSQTEAVLPALIGSTLRGAFGHALKVIACSMPHQNCEKCFLSDVCLYPTIFEPISKSRFKDLPRPFVFEPPVPFFTREISESKNLKIRVLPNGQISYGLTLIGDAINKMPYFIYAFDLMARHGLGGKRHPFHILRVFQTDENLQKHLIYEPYYSQIKTFQNKTLKDFVSNRLNDFEFSSKLKIRLQTPLRIRRKDEFGNKYLLEKIEFKDFFKQCSLRLQQLSQIYGIPFKYDYAKLMKDSEGVKIAVNNLWRHDSVRLSNRRNKNLELDGMLGEIEYAFAENKELIQIILGAEMLNIGSAIVMGLGKFNLFPATESTADRK